MQSLCDAMTDTNNTGWCNLKTVWL